jgi:peptidoglycan/LPS O-acetylase OafA/YrhL
MLNAIAIVGLVIATLGSDNTNVAQTFYALLFASVIVAAYRGIGGIGGRLLESPSLVALGTVSYGIYVYHVFAPRAVGLGLRALEAPSVLHSDVPLFILSFILTLLVAALSWRLIERPIMSLGRRRVSPRSASLQSPKSVEGYHGPNR